MDPNSSEVFKKYVSDLIGYVKARKRQSYTHFYDGPWPPDPAPQIIGEVPASGPPKRTVTLAECEHLSSIVACNPRYLDWTWRFWPLFSKNWLLLLLHNKATWYEHAHLEDKDFTLLWSYLFPLKQSEQDKDCAELTWHRPLTLPLSETQTRLRELIQQQGAEWDFALLSVGQDKYVIYSRAIYFFILAHNPQWWWWAFEAFKKCYSQLIAPDDRFWKNETFEIAFMRAAFKTNPSIRVKFMLQDKTDRNPSFVISASFERDVYIRLKDELWFAYKGPVDANLRQNDSKLFAETFEGEWEYLKATFSDMHFGFTVHPCFTFNDMISYAGLPKGLKKLRIVSEMIDYAVLRVAPTAMLTADQVDPERVKKWMNLIAALYGPFLAEGFAKLPAKSRPTKEQMESMVTQAIKEIWSMAGWGYNFWYKKQAASEDDPMAYFMLVGTMQAVHVRPEDIDKMALPDDRKATWLKMARWVRPSYYIFEHLGRKYLGKPTRNERRQTIERVGLRQEIVIDKKRYLTVEGMAQRLNRSPQTVRRLANSGEIPYVWHKTDKGSRMRLFHCEGDKQIEQLQLGLLKDKDLAKNVGLSTRQLRNIKHTLAKSQKLGRIESKRRLVAHLRTRRSS